ncbi:hypothetical protein SMICM304S_08012 [Streptomyces microflavus]
MSAEQGSSKVLTLTKSVPAPAVLASSPEAIDTRTLSRSRVLRLAALGPASGPEGTDSPERTYVRDMLIRSSTSRWCVTQRRGSAAVTNRWRTSSRSARSA